MANAMADRKYAEALLEKLDGNEMTNLVWCLWNANYYDSDFVREVIEIITAE